MPFAIWALAAGAFAICTSEFIIMGLLLEVAHDLNIKIGQAGFLVTGYALGVVLGAPFLTPFLLGLNRKAVLVGLMLLFTVGNLACAVAPTYEMLLIARLITALSQATFFGLGAVVAAKLVTPDKQANAIAAMFIGATLANILGAPLGAAIGQSVGWRSTFIVIACLGLIAALAISRLLPYIETERTINLRQEFKTLVQPSMIRALLITVLGFGGTFTLFTYIAPILTQITGAAQSTVPFLLLVFGLGLALGNPIGARLASQNITSALRITLSSLILIMLAVYFVMNSFTAMVIVIFFFGAATFATIPPLQLNVMAVAGKAPVLASAFNIAALNLGNACGAWIGGVTIDHGIYLTKLPLIAAGISAIGLFLSYYQVHSKKIADIH
ncbi:MFS transporter [Acinetobacter qingfengensis]|uniref:Arabinose transporter permease n=1 Tax=Acinetobacter qingfengensis TaxID=1262585 RepID=A0A1E7QXJ0_9GAMM|nr:MFS transporter [Acinetobacter qingfengensis]KAA8731661.1 MFS transporter [Acinetobacter qingfengensis]OEY91763.1 arabinose transporter permease [Acinetobacter qingfengensis]